MKVVSVGSLPPGLGGQRTGGVASYHADLLGGLERLGGFDLTIFCGDAQETHAWPLANVGLTGRQEEAAFVAACQDADVVVLHHVHHRFGTYWSRNAITVPTVAVLHSLKGLQSGDPARDAAATDRARAARRLVMPSRHLAREAAWLRGDIEAIHPPLADDFLAGPVDSGRHRVAAFVGTLEDRKGVLPFLEAMATLKDWRAVVVGTGPRDADARERAARPDLAGRVTLLGDVRDRRAIVDLLDRAAVLCVPSDPEPFGICYIEALARGAAVVGYAPSIDEISAAMDMACGQGVAQEAAAIAAAIETVHAAGHDRRELARRTRARFGPDACASAFARLFQRMLGSDPTLS